MQDKPYNSLSKSDTIQVSQKDIDVFKVRLVGADKMHARDAFLTKDEELVLKDLKRKLRDPNGKGKRIDNYDANASRLFDSGFIIADHYSGSWVISQEGLRYLRCQFEDKRHKFISYFLSIIAIIISCIALALEVEGRATTSSSPIAVHDVQEALNDSSIP